MKPIITVENLSKHYQIGARQDAPAIAARTLASTLRAPFKRLRRMGRATTETMWALKDINFEVKPGEIVGIIGRNGAGKSTLLKILSRITEPTTGRIKLYGRIGSLLEVGTGFHPELTGRENIYLNGTILGMKRQEITNKFDEIVAFAEIERFLDTPVKRYSSGMYVRLAFAVAAHLEPEVLIVDEVLAVGDAAFQKKCLGKIEDVAKQGRTVLFVSHNAIAVKSLCNRVILLHGGRLAEDGIASQVLGHYLGAGRTSKAEVIWDDPKQAPGNEVFRIHSARLRNAEGKITSEVNTSNSFSIEVEYRNLAEGNTLGATVVLYDKDGVCVFSSPSNQEQKWHGRSFPAGLFRSKCHIPGNFLSEGYFSVSVIVWANNYTSAHREDGIIEFEVHDSSETRNDYFGEWVGVVRPLLQWDTEYLEKERLQHL